MLGAVHRRLGELEAKSLAQRLPPLPQSLNAILRELRSPDATVFSVGKLVASDPVLSGRLLRMARSGFYSRGREVRRVEEAVARLGLRTTRNLALAASVRQLAPPEHLNYDAKGFFLHSFATASVAVQLGRKRTLDADLLFLAGLMHDIGLLVGVEGYEHAEIGKIVATYWKLPAEVIGIIGSHHQESSDPLVQVVRFSDLACDAFGVGLAEPVPFVSEDPLYLEAQELVEASSELAQEAYRALE